MTGRLVGGSGLEGRVGLTRREYPGVPPGTYVEVEEAVPGSGWYITLTQRDLRDSRSSGWGIWAETEEELTSWLRPEVLDVEWLTEPLPDETVEDLVGDVDEGWSFRYVSPDGVAAWLHDADVSLSEVELVGAVAVVPGFVESVWESPTRRFRWPRALSGRFPFVLVVDSATAVHTEDPEGIDQVIVGDVEYDQDAQRLVIDSAIPGAIRITTPAATYRLATARRPALVRRWWRWQPLDSDDPPHERLTDTAHGPAGCVHYAGPPRVNPTPSRSELRRFGLPEPHETLEIDVSGFPAWAKRKVVSRLLAELASRDRHAELYEAHRRGGWQRARAADAATDFVAAIDSDASWAGDLALLVRTSRGPAVVCSAADGHIIVVATGGYRRLRLRVRGGGRRQCADRPRRGAVTSWRERPVPARGTPPAPRSA
jgi:hypothetical protein